MANPPDESMKGMTFTMTERRILTHLGAREAPVTVVEIARALRLPYAAERAIGPLWGRALVEREIVDEGDVVRQVWSLSPRGHQVVEAGLMVHPRDGAVHIVRGPWPPPAINKPAMSCATAMPATPLTTAADQADAWLAALPRAPAELRPAVTGSLVWTYDGARFAARAVERSEGTVTLQYATVLRAGFLFTEAEARYPFLVLKESSVIGMAPLTELDEQ
jgi:hypothetical protein